MDNKEIIPGWELVEKIGSGGFSTVYKIRKSRSAGSGEYYAALKVIKIPNTPDEYENYAQEGYDHNTITSIFENQVKKLEEEFHLMSRFKGNSNIVSYEDHMITPHADGKGWDIFIRMELLEPLMKYYNQNPLDVKETVKLGIDICRALEICQRFNVIHRDIKPQNIFVNDLGDYKLGDFGIARTMDHTTHATKIGTYTYIAPEVYRGDKYNSDVDIYSLGLVLYWLLNERRLPFLPLPPATPKPTDISEATSRRLDGEQLPPPKNGSNELKQIVLKACSFNSADRYKTAMEMRMELEREFFALSYPDSRRNSATPYGNTGGNQAGVQGNNVGDSLGEWQSNVIGQNSSGRQQGNMGQKQSAFADEKTMNVGNKKVESAPDFGIDKTTPIVLPHQGGNYRNAQNTGNPNMGRPNTDNPNMGRPNTGNPNTGNPNMGRPNTGNPNMGSPNTGNPNMGNPNMGNPNTGRPNTNNPNMGNPNTGRPNTGNPNTGSRPNTSNPNTGSRPNTSNPNTGNPNMGSRPNTSNPNTGRPNTNTGSNPNTGSPYTGNPNANGAAYNPNMANAQWVKTKSSKKAIAIIITAIYIFFVISAVESGIPLAMLFFAALSLPVVKITGKLTLTVYTCGQVKVAVANNSITISGSGDMPYCKDASALLWYSMKANIKKVVIENGITSVGDNYFFGFSNVNSVTLGGTVTKIGDNAFCGCASIKNINIPVGVTRIGKNAFCGCSSLTEAMFANPNGWFVSESNATLNELQVSLVSGVTSANYLKNIYCSFYWYKK